MCKRFQGLPWPGEEDVKTQVRKICVWELDRCGNGESREEIDCIVGKLDMGFEILDFAVYTCSKVTFFLAL